MKSTLKVILFLCLLVFSHQSCFSENQIAETKRPNILFIAVDDLKPMLGCYGDRTIQTPNIDALAGSGVAFQNAYCQQAVCAPTRASLMTGLRPDSTGVWDLKTRIRDVHPDIVTLPQHFKANGYRSVGMGKIFDPRSVNSYLKDDPESWSEPYLQVRPNQEIELGYLNAETRERIRCQKERIGKKSLNIDDLKTMGGLPPYEGSEDVADEAYEDGRIAEKAVETLQRLSSDSQPFFLAVGFLKPHLPFIAPKKYWDQYDRSQFSPDPVRNAPEGAPSFHPQPGWELRNGTYSGVPLLGVNEGIPDETAVTLIHGYHACVSYLDAQIGKLLEALDANGLRDNTIIVFWGDHGWHLGDHGIWCKHTNFEQATRVPMIIVDPRESYVHGKTASSLAEFVDIFPTLCELASIPVPETLEGQSLVAVMKNSELQVKPFAVSQFPRDIDGKEIMGYAFRTHRFRYIEWMDNRFREGGKLGPIVATELYDYEKDPLETRNGVELSEYSDALRQMKTYADQYFGR